MVRPGPDAEAVMERSLPDERAKGGVEELGQRPVRQSPDDGGAIQPGQLRSFPMRIVDYGTASLGECPPLRACPQEIRARHHDDVLHVVTE